MKHSHNLKYGSIYRKLRKSILSQNPTCYWCHWRPATTIDHDPPLASVEDLSQWRGNLRPSCAKCNYSRGASFGNKKRKAVRPSRNW
jgi:hypothetical protein